MRATSVAILAALSASGCLSGSLPGIPDDAAQGNGVGDCPIQVDPPTGGGGVVEVQAANSMDKDTCVRVYFDGVLVASGDLPGESEVRTHNNPRPLSSFSWEGRDVLIEIQDSETGRKDSERIRLFETRTYVAVWAGRTDTTVRVYDAPPKWV